VLSRIGTVLLNILGLIAAILTRILGLLFLIVAGICITLLISILLGWDTSIRLGDGPFFYDEHLGHLVQALFTDNLHRMLFLWSAGALLVIPFIGLLLLGIRLFFDFKGIPGYLGSALTALFIVAIVLMFYNVARLMSEFQHEAQYSEQIPLPSLSSDTLVLDLLPGADPEFAFKTGFGSGQLFFHGLVTFPDLDSTQLLYMGANRFTVTEEMAAEHFELNLKRNARGSGYKDAVQHARAISSRYEVSGDTLRIHPHFSLAKGTLLRKQEALYELAVPVGKRIHFTVRSARLLHDVPNVSNTYDEAMAGHTWIMTQNGLLCETCTSRPRKVKSTPIEY